jgi:hypothetical protein
MRNARFGCENREESNAAMFDCVVSPKTTVNRPALKLMATAVAAVCQIGVESPGYL